MADYVPLSDGGREEEGDARRPKEGTAGTGATTARLASLDAFRGLSIALMVFVDYAGSIFPFVAHSPWNGVRLADFVTPFFLFIAGISLSIVYKKIPNKFQATQKAFLRAMKLFLLGLLLQGPGGGHAFHLGSSKVLTTLLLPLIVSCPRCIDASISTTAGCWCSCFLDLSATASCVKNSNMSFPCYYQLPFLEDWRSVARENQVCLGFILKLCDSRVSEIWAHTFFFFLFLSSMIVWNLVLKHIRDRKVHPYMHNLFSSAATWVFPGGYFHGANSLTFGVDIEKIRWLGILQRIAIGYMVAALCEIWSSSTRSKDVRGGLFMNYCLHWIVILLLSGIYLGLLYGLYVPDWSYNMQLTTSSNSSFEGSYAMKMVDVTGCRCLTFVLEWIGRHSLSIFILIASNVAVIVIQGFYWRNPENNIVHWIISLIVHK